MGVFAIYLGFAVPGQLTNVFIGIFALYLVTTAWMTVRRRERAPGFSEKWAFLVALCLFAPFAILTFQLAVGLPPLCVSGSRWLWVRDSRTDLRGYYPGLITCRRLSSCRSFCLWG
jgi:hypothetical protein